MLHLHHSNQFERLAEELASVIADQSPAPLAPEILVVPSSGVARWLSLALARRQGICANLRMYFPAELVWEVARAALPGVPTQSSFDREILLWRVLRALGQGAEGEGFGPVEAYLADGDDLKRYELAAQIAHCFDQYLVYRPDLIRRWEAGQDNHWQARLWRQLARETTDTHWARLQESVLSALKRGDPPIGRLPPRVSLFGVSALSPGYLAILAELAHHIDVHVFLLNPCRQYWGDIVSERDLAARTGEARKAMAHAESGNALLSSLGKQGRDFVDMLLECEPQEHDLFVEPGEDSMLHRIQSDILDLRNTGARARRSESRSAGHCSSITATARCAKWRCCTISCSHSSRSAVCGRLMSS